MSESQVASSTAPWWDRLLTLAALVGVVMLTLTLGAHVSGVQPLVVRSGSMEPTVATGSMVLVRDARSSASRSGTSCRSYDRTAPGSCTAS